QDSRDLADLPADDLPLDLKRRAYVGFGGARAHRAQTDAVLVETEHAVLAAAEGPADERLDRQEHGRVDALLRARQHVRPEERLVGVHPDPPHAFLARGVERAEAAAACDLEDDTRAVGDLGEGELLAFRSVVPVL